jgi:hypothetical protein
MLSQKLRQKDINMKRAGLIQRKCHLKITNNRTEKLKSNLSLLPVLTPNSSIMKTEY